MKQAEKKPTFEIEHSYTVGVYAWRPRYKIRRVQRIKTMIDYVKKLLVVHRVGFLYIDTMCGLIIRKWDRDTKKYVVVFGELAPGGDIRSICKPALDGFLQKMKEEDA